jgi:hypothetical protein
MNRKAKPLVLTMYTLVCVIIPAAGVIPSVIAQEVATSLAEEEELASGIVSDVLEGSGDDEGQQNDAGVDGEIIDEDSMDNVTANSNQDGSTIDQTESNEFGDNTAVSIDRDEEEQQQQLTVTPRPDDGPPLSEDAVFCLEGGLTLGILCSSTLEDCEFVQERLESVISECKGIETPPGAAFCTISEDGKNIKCESRD